MKNQSAPYSIPVAFERRLAAWQAVVTLSPVKLCAVCNRMEQAFIGLSCPRCGGLMRDITSEYTASVYRNFSVTQESRV